MGVRLHTRPHPATLCGSPVNERPRRRGVQLSNLPFDTTYVICTRRVRSGFFRNEPGPVAYLEVPDGQDPTPEHKIAQRAWFNRVRDLADGVADNQIDTAGDVLVFIHGYNNDQAIVIDRHRQLQGDLWKEGFRGLVVSFDWPSASSPVNYLEDRWDASKTAITLVTGCIVHLAARQKADCHTNVHLLGHSTGAYVIREAFYHARKKGVLHRNSWKVSQVGFVGGDIASATLAENDTISHPLFERTLRITNYSNHYDKALKVSNAKRFGLRPRVGRVGVPRRAHPSVVNVDCSPYFRDLNPASQPRFGKFCHSWHIGNEIFSRDFAYVLRGGVDRHAIPTRYLEDGRLFLQTADRLSHEAEWLAG